MINRSKQRFICFDLMVVALILIAAPIRAEYIHTEKEKRELMVVELKVEQELAFNLEAFLIDDEVYLPVEELFRHLNIKIEYENEDQELDIYFPDRKNPINLELNDNDFQEGQQYILENRKVYLHEQFLEYILGFEISFDFRELVVELSSPVELPVVKAQKRRQRYARFTTPKETFQPDVVLPPNRRIFDDLLIDWSVRNSHTLSNHHVNYNVNIGGQFLGGDLTIRGAGSDTQALNSNSLRGVWTYPIYNTSLIRKIKIGEFNHRNRLDFTGGSMRGIKITNRRHERPYYFSRMDFSDQVEAEMDTEFYLNSRLYDVVTSDDGATDLEAPLRYGSNWIEVKQYSASGLEERRQYHIYVPNELISRGQLEYTLSAGEYQTGLANRAGKGSVKLGLTNGWTLGGGALTEMIGDELRTTSFYQSWMRLGKRIVLKGQHIMDYSTEGSLQFNFSQSRKVWLNLQRFQSSELNRTNRYLRGSIYTNLPIYFGSHRVSIYANSRYSQSQSGFHNVFNYNGLSTRFIANTMLRIRNRLRYQGLDWRELNNIQFTTEGQLSRRLLHRLYLQPSIIYNHRLQELTNVKGEMRLRLGAHTYVDFQYERDLLLNTDRFLFTLKIDFPFAHQNSRAQLQGSNVRFDHYTGGSIGFNRKGRSIHVDKNRQVGKASLIAVPFLDINNNGERENDEPRLESMRMDVGRPNRPSPVVRNAYIANRLIPYYQYNFKVSDEYLPNPLWRTNNQRYRRRVVPNSFNTVSVPVTPVGEVAGKIKRKDNSYFASSDFEVNISSHDGHFSKTLSTYSGGSFYYVGLLPGKYIASLNRSRLKEKSLIAKTDSIAFTIKPHEQGDIVEGLTFEVYEQVAETVTADEDPKKVEKKVQFEQDSFETIYVIQTGAFEDERNARVHADQTQLRLNRNVMVNYDEADKLYKSRIGFFNSYEEAEKVKESLRNMSSDAYEDVFIVKMMVQEYR